MAETTIEWTWRPRPDGSLMPGYTFNPWIGCSKVHEGCRNCYAERDFDTRRHVAKWGPHGTRVVTSGDNWRKPLKWNREAAAMDENRLVFCASLADVFEQFEGQLTNHAGWRTAIEDCGDGIENICHIDPALSLNSAPKGTHWATLDDIRAQLFRLIDATPNLTWLLLTKRPENVPAMWCSHSNTDGKPPSQLHRRNVWLGTSVSDQASAEKQIPQLLKARALSPVLFLSCEPLLDPLDLRKWTTSTSGSQWQVSGGPNECLHGIAAGIHCGDCNRVDWVIAGGESGPNARPCHPDSIRGLRDQCAAGDVPFFFKQWGEWSPTEIDPQTAKLPGALNDVRGQIEKVVEFTKVGKAKAGATLDGAEHRQFPTPKGSD